MTKMEHAHVSAAGFTTKIEHAHVGAARNNILTNSIACINEKNLE